MGELLDLLERVASPEDPREFSSRLASAVARDNVNGVYRALFRLIASPPLLEANAQRVWGTYVDEGTMTVRIMAPGSFEGRVRGWSHHHVDGVPDAAALRRAPAPRHRLQRVRGRTDSVRGRRRRAVSLPGDLAAVAAVPLDGVGAEAGSSRQTVAVSAPPAPGGGCPLLDLGLSGSDQPAGRWGVGALGGTARTPAGLWSEWCRPKARRGHPPPGALRDASGKCSRARLQSVVVGTRSVRTRASDASHVVPRAFRCRPRRLRCWSLSHPMSGHEPSDVDLGRLRCWSRRLPMSGHEPSDVGPQRLRCWSRSLPMSAHEASDVDLGRLRCWSRSLPM